MQPSAGKQSLECLAPDDAEELELQSPKLSRLILCEWVCELVGMEFSGLPRTG